MNIKPTLQKLLKHFYRIVDLILPNTTTVRIYNIRLIIDDCIIRCLMTCYWINNINIMTGNNISICFQNQIIQNSSLVEQVIITLFKDVTKVFSFNNTFNRRQCVLLENRLLINLLYNYFCLWKVCKEKGNRECKEN